jgi:transposase
MLSFETGRRIFVARAATDMRKSFNTLSALVEHQLGHDPFAGDVFVFIGRAKNRMKVLVWDASGFWLCARRLEEGTFAVPKPLLDAGSKDAVQVSPGEMAFILEGISVHRATYHRHYHRPDHRPAPRPTTNVKSGTTTAQ